MTVTAIVTGRVSIGRHEAGKAKSRPVSAGLGGAETGALDGSRPAVGGPHDQASV
jgi:hypothetical protein